MLETFWSWKSPAIELVWPWNLRIRVSYIPNYKTAISDKITCWKGEQFPWSLCKKTFGLTVNLSEALRCDCYATRMNYEWCHFSGQVNKNDFERNVNEKPWLHKTLTTMRTLRKVLICSFKHSMWDDLLLGKIPVTCRSWKTRKNECFIKKRSLSNQHVQLRHQFASSTMDG